MTRRPSLCEVRVLIRVAQQRANEPLYFASSVSISSRNALACCTPTTRLSLMKDLGAQLMALPRALTYSLAGESQP